MSLRHRLQRLEQVLRGDFAIQLVCVNEAGLVLDDGSEQIRPWSGKHYSEVPGPPKVLVGVDPLEVLGRRLAKSDGREQPGRFVPA